MDPNDYLPMPTSGLERLVRKTEHIPEIARVHIMPSLEDGHGDSGVGGGEGGGGKYQNLLPPSKDMETYMQKVLQCGAVCCSVLQCVAVCCSVLQCVVICCSVL